MVEPIWAWRAGFQDSGGCNGRSECGSATQAQFRALDARVMLLSLYCAVAVLGPLLYLILSFDQLFAESDTNRQQVFVATILTGVLGSALRGMSNLFSDVGKGRYQPSWNLSILMRPLGRRRHSLGFVSRNNCRAGPAGAGATYPEPIGISFRRSPVWDVFASCSRCSAKTFR